MPQNRFTLTRLSARAKVVEARPGPWAEQTPSKVSLGAHSRRPPSCSRGGTCQAAPFRRRPPFPTASMAPRLVAGTALVPSSLVNLARATPAGS